MKIGQITDSSFAAKIGTDGIRLRCGPFVSHIVSELPEIAETIWTLYSDFDLATESIADFHLRVIARRSPFHRRAELIAEGRSLFGLFPRNESVAMLEWGLNACVCAWAHDFMIIHAAIVAQQNAALVMPGGPGAGKSTLATALVARGWRLLSDELTLIRPHGGEAVPLVRPISLKNESIEIASRIIENPVFGPICDVRRKGRMAHLKPDFQSVACGQKPAYPRVFVLPSFNRDGLTYLQPISRAQTFVSVAENALNYGVLHQLGFEALALVISRSQGYRLQYSEVDSAVDELERLFYRGVGAEKYATGAV